MYERLYVSRSEAVGVLCYLLEEKGRIGLGRYCELYKRAVFSCKIIFEVVEGSWRGEDDTMSSCP